MPPHARFKQTSVHCAAAHLLRASTAFCQLRVLVLTHLSALQEDTCITARSVCLRHAPQVGDRVALEVLVGSKTITNGTVVSGSDLMNEPRVKVSAAVGSGCRVSGAVGGARGCWVGWGPVR